MAWVVFSCTKLSSLRVCVWLRQCELSPTQPWHFTRTRLTFPKYVEQEVLGLKLVPQVVLVPVPKVITQLEMSKQTLIYKWIRLEGWN